MILEVTGNGGSRYVTRLRATGDAGDHPERALAAQPQYFAGGKHPGILPGRAGHADLAVLQRLKHELRVVGLEQRPGRRRGVDQIFVSSNTGGVWCHNYPVTMPGLLGCHGRQCLVGGLHEFVGWYPGGVWSINYQ
jgi:hypothetical protein